MDNMKVEAREPSKTEIPKAAILLALLLSSNVYTFILHIHAYINSNTETCEKFFMMINEILCLRVYIHYVLKNITMFADEPKKLKCCHEQFSGAFS